MKKFSLRLPDEVYDLVKARAGQVGISMNEIILNYILSRVYDDGYHHGLIHVKNARKIKG
ncbi:MAG: Arc family DNA-binding protein [Candidatus Methanospirareceae archaeon]